MSSPPTKLARRAPADLRRQTHKAHRTVCHPSIERCGSPQATPHRCSLALFNPNGKPTSDVVTPNSADLPSRHALPNGGRPNVAHPNNAGLPSQHAHPNAVHPNTVDHPNQNANPARPNSADLQNPVPSTPADAKSLLDARPADPSRLGHPNKPDPHKIRRAVVAAASRRNRPDLRNPDPNRRRMPYPEQRLRTQSLRARK